MKLKTILENIINEGASDTLYHFMQTVYALDVLKKNRFNMIAAMGDDADYQKNNNKFYYLSTTRSRSSGWRVGNTKLVLDGRKLTQRYKIIPVDYFNKYKSDKQNTRDYIDALQSLEQEDRIVTDSPFIRNADTYIKEVHIYVENESKKLLKSMVLECEKNNIPIFLYDTRENYQNQRNPINYSEFLDIEDSNFKGYGDFINPSSFNKIAAVVAYKNDDAYDKIIKFLEDAKEIEEFKNTFDEWSEHYIPEDGKRSYTLISLLKNNLSNIKSSSDIYSKFILDLLRRDLRLNKILSIEDYIKMKRKE
jgi:hypothetical protein